MATTTLGRSRARVYPVGLAVPAFLVLLVVALTRGDESPSAADTDSGSGLGAFLRRLMLDLFAWLGSLFGLGRSEADDEPDYPAGGAGGREGAGRFPPRGRRISTASPQEVEHISSSGGSTVVHPEFSESSEERAAGGVPDANASPEGAGSAAAASAEQMDGVVLGGGVDGLREDDGGDPSAPAPVVA